MGSNKKPSAEERRLNLARSAALEWRERYRKVLAGQDAVWNSAIDHCSSAFGEIHNPMHRSDECLLCYVHRKLQSAYRLENAGYIPVKDRLLGHLSMFEMNARADNRLPRAELRAYCRALKDVREAVEKCVTEAI